MSLLEYAKDKNMDIVTMDNLVKKFKDTSDDIELTQLLEFMSEKINVLMKESSKKSTQKEVISKQKNNVIVKESNEIVIKSFKITTDKLYLMINKSEALEYQFDKGDISQCYEIISTQRIAKTDIGNVFKKVSL